MAITKEGRYCANWDTSEVPKTRQLLVNGKPTFVYGICRRSGKIVDCLHRACPDFVGKAREEQQEGQ